jgi:soluble lytic murein transglycosylase-like protein
MGKRMRNIRNALLRTLYAVSLAGAFLGGAIGADAAATQSAQAVYTVPQMIEDAAWWYGLDPQTMLAIAWCESKYRPDAVGRYGEQGVFQFTWRTWNWASKAAGYGGWSPQNPVANVTTAAWLAAHDGLQHWDSCR